VRTADEPQQQQQQRERACPPTAPGRAARLQPSPVFVRCHELFLERLSTRLSAGYSGVLVAAAAAGGCGRTRALGGSKPRARGFFSCVRRPLPPQPRARGTGRRPWLDARADAASTKPGQPWRSARIGATPRHAPVARCLHAMPLSADVLLLSRADPDGTVSGRMTGALPSRRRPHKQALQSRPRRAPCRHRSRTH
jgi:hypothetical protein